MDQWNRIEIPEIDPHKYSQLIFGKESKTIPWKNDSLFKKYWQNNSICTCQKMSLETKFILFTKTNSKPSPDLNIK